ncbi:tyrosine-type recombinase/integrase [Pseudoalteromonas rubra]|uniref:tyrosine-type recombinase/integrase n=1 Tax=Pseudoalteromonas rubra TaxID=43658 RepID=UPI002DBF4409|nr:tyrosine-type recombinase/integrase [Pseudoalteromonas rubra]MEC4091133.1 tyrosine-type recombinase/integrase [Pseudoalteromonas rubra]
MGKYNLTETAVSGLSIPAGRKNYFATFIGYRGLQLYLRWKRPGQVMNTALDRKLNTVYNWRIRYTKAASNSRTFISLGNYPEISVEDIQVKYAHVISLIDRGIDPQQEKLQEKIRQTQVQSMIDGFSKPSSVNVLFEQLKADWPKTGKSQTTLRNYTYNFNHYILPTFNGRDIRSILAAEWEDHILEMANVQKRPGNAQEAHKVMRLLCSFAVERGILEYNPLLGRKNVLRAVRGGKSDAHLDSHALHKFLNELHEQPAERWVKTLAEVMLRVGVRSIEWARVKVGWINFQKMRIEHPAESIKTRQRAWTHLPENVVSLLIEHLQYLKSEYGELRPEMYLFHNIGKPDHQVSETLYTTKFKKFHSWIHITPKMMRKTLSTHLQQAGCPHEARRAVLNQVVDEGVGGHYDFADLFATKKMWIERWQTMLDDVAKDPSALVADTESQLNEELASKVGELFE